ncbi:Abi family protein [Oxalobacter formigenes]|nr:Abi family protein [Oxalobacter formigenes]QDX32935.1 Abi family protein [Oxalobacter formigenes]WAW00875.1 Abi family protein [Oxalobacter formigenes]WAW03205.1 Abi family protein [Oxalobacter formigenes]WAW06357.1 Abi family protein [Oxalobacter formigenes]WAW07257.1 Abi family protein [Oxalobacter formigenes]
MKQIPFVKPFMPVEHQAKLLRLRGLQGPEETIVSRLISVGYYRLSAYWFPFREVEPDGSRNDRIRSGTTIDQVWNYYLFDRKLRLLFLDAIERIEVALRSRVAHYYSAKFGPFGYINYIKSSSLKQDQITHFVTKNKLRGSTDFRCKQFDFVQHFIDTYSDDHLPVWMAVHTMELGMIVNILFSAAPSDIKKAVASDLGLDQSVSLNWLQCILSLRNSCAHHARVWNKNWLDKSVRAPSSKEWFFTYEPNLNKWINQKKRIVPSFVLNRTAAFLMICRILMKKIAPQSKWHKRIEDLVLNEFSGKIHFKSMGLPENWQKHPFWI